MGGEESVCILPNTTIDRAVIISEKLRLNIMSLQIPHDNSSVESCVTISLGVASITPDMNSSCDVLIKAADEALYRSKESGRNKVSI